MAFCDLPLEVFAKIMDDMSPRDMWRLQCVSRGLRALCSSPFGIGSALRLHESHLETDRMPQEHIHRETIGEKITRVRSHTLGKPLAGCRLYELDPMYPTMKRMPELSGKYIVTLRNSKTITVADLRLGENSFTEECDYDILAYVVHDDMLYWSAPGGIIERRVADWMFGEECPDSFVIPEQKSRESSSNMICHRDHLYQLYHDTTWRQTKLLQVHLETAAVNVKPLPFRFIAHTGSGCSFGRLEGHEDLLLWFESQRSVGADGFVYTKISVKEWLAGESPAGSDVSEATLRLPSVNIQAITAIRSTRTTVSPTGYAGQWRISVTFHTYYERHCQQAIYTCSRQMTNGIGRLVELKTGKVTPDAVWKDTLYFMSDAQAYGMVGIASARMDTQDAFETPIRLGTLVFPARTHSTDLELLMVNESFMVDIRMAHSWSVVTAFTYEPSLLRQPHIYDVEDMRAVPYKDAQFKYVDVANILEHTTRRRISWSSIDVHESVSSAKWLRDPPLTASIRHAHWTGFIWSAR